jgi:hypothetical protein
MVYSKRRGVGDTAALVMTATLHRLHPPEFSVATFRKKSERSFFPTVLCGEDGGAWGCTVSRESGWEDGGTVGGHTVTHFRAAINGYP